MSTSKIPLSLVIGFYGVLAVAAVFWDWLRDGPSRLLCTTDLDVLRDVGLGIGLAVPVILASRLLDRTFRWARELSQRLHAMLGRLSQAEIVTYSVSSGVAEEMFFRGAMQPTLGLVVTSILFGLCHGLLDKQFVAWTVFAIVLGFLLGLLFRHTGSLLGPVVAHFTINFVNFQALNRVEPAR